MAIELVHVSRCWCGSERISTFADHYLRCKDCGTLINSPRLPDRCFGVGDDERHFYNKHYWFAYQRERHGLPDIVQRARNDLPERCLYWLDTVVRYKRPPGRSLEIGCSHGGFVALMKMAGFDAMGVELSPWVADYAAQTFSVPVHCGTLADLEIEPESLDCVILMDVLEHLPDPKATMCAIVRALKPDGIVVIQTPCYRDNGPSWEMLIDQEHLFLFTEDGLRRLLAQVGLSHVAVTPHLFPHDMFLIAGTSPLTESSQEEIDASLLDTPDRRRLLALFDLYRRLRVSTEQLAVVEADRAARLGVIEEQGRQLGALQQQLAVVEADRAARLGVIEEQGRQLGALEGERNVLQAQLGALQQQREVVEADRAARLGVIEEQGRQLGALQQQLSKVQVEKERALQALLAISRTRAYRLLRRLRRWEWVEQILAQASPDSPA
jgi:2-polyprenyl-3-methyl-5-hydroxy-6-metoxy-1,4-benzoquinol methylase